MKIGKYQISGRRQLLYPCIRAKIIKMCNNYRTISLLSVSEKAYGSLDGETDGSN